MMTSKNPYKFGATNLNEALDIDDIDLTDKSTSNKKIWKYFAIAVVAVIIVGLISGLIAWAVIQDHEDPLVATTISVPVNTNVELRRIDCYPEASGGVDLATQKKCENRGCIWAPSETDNVPYCYVPQPEDNVPFGYSIIGGPEETLLGERWYLQRINQFAIYGENIEFLTFDVEYRDDHILRFKFDDTNDISRFKVPVPLNLGSVKAVNPVYRVEVLLNETFAFRVVRTATGNVLWDSSVGGFVYTDQFLQISTRLPSSNIYGMGENLHKSLKHDLNFVTWPLWSRDQPPHSGDDSANYNLYSVHPMYECIEEDGNAHGVFFFNANAMDYTLTPLPMLTYKTIGGILDFMMFFGPTPDNVVQQYTGVVGRPYMPPYFMLGYQQSRYGYRNTEMIRDAVNRTLYYDIPLDVQYVDIDHMYKQRDFTLDKEAFADLPEYFKEIRERGIRTVIILDPTLEINDTYSPYLEGVEKDIFIKWPDIETMPEGDYEEYNRTDMMGSVWPEWKCVFPDFFLNETADLWTKWITEFRTDVIEFDVLWVDMNEPANFDTNGWRPWNWPDEVPTNWTLKCPNNTYDDPPYRTKAAYMYDVPSEGKEERINGKTICMVGTQEGGKYRHYDLHSLYGWKQSEISLSSMRAALKSVYPGSNQRSMVLSRSTYSGSGQYTGSWLGDNAATWKDMYLSIIGMLEYNVFGLPYVGADICGFFNNCTANLCMRWQELGAFYPYSRNHNHEEPHNQDPGFFGPEVAARSRATLLIRYKLLPYLYTLFYRANTQGNTVVKPLFHEYPADNNTWDIDRQFLWGPCLLVTPILEENPTDLSYYVPRGRWYDWYTFGLHLETEGEWQTMLVSIDTPIQLHVQGGHIVPWQVPANNTQFSRLNPFGLIVALDGENGQASGELFWDDGDSIDTYENGMYYFASYSADTNFLNIYVEHNGIEEDMSTLNMDTIQVLGAVDVNFVYVNGTQHSEFTYDNELQVLEITSLELSMNGDFEIFWSSTSLASDEEADRLDCCPEVCDEQTCVSEPKFCIWEPSNTTGVPSCYINDEFYGYSGQYEENGVNYTKWKAGSSMFGEDIENITVTATQHGHIFRLKIEDYNDPDRYQVPIDLNLPSGEPDEMFNPELSYEPNFAFRVTRSGDSIDLFDTSIGGFTFADQFIQITTRLATTNVYGFGEHVHSSFKHNFYTHSVWPMFARDEPPKSGANLYSTHPFYMVVEEDGKSHGVLFWNSNAMEVVFSPAPAVTFRSVGGIVDIYIIIGDNPEEVIQRYHQMIGYAYLPPYWSLGFQISRYGYETLDNMKAAVDRTRAANIPLDVVHMDIDSFEEYKSFTWDKTRFDGLPQYIGEVHDMKMKAILLVDPFLISNETNYLPYDLGLERDVFVKWPVGTSPDHDVYNNDNLLGWAWPIGKVVFPDYFHRNSTGYWEDVILDYHRQIPFDGLWLDMNEPANFGTNEEKPWNWPDGVGPLWSLKCPNDTKWENPPYKPISMYGQWLCDKTICMTAVQNNSQLRHYDVHSLYGHTQTIPTLSGLQKAVPGKRGLVITRSTFPGTGAYGGRWLGDNAAIWPHLKDSIIGMLEFNLFGIPYVGADICGYFDSCPEALCQRWQQLGAFYTFSRNHNGLNYDDQDPGNYGPGMQASTRKVLSIRYQLLPYLYTLFYHAHTRGGTVIRPLFHEFPTDVRALRTDEQFLWGPSLLISPVLREHETEVVAYFPANRWFDFYTGKEVSGTGRSHRLDAPLDYIPIHVRGGFILPMQEPANTTFHSRLNAFNLLVTPNATDQASGDLFWDDGESVDTVTNGSYCLLTFTYVTNTLTMTYVHRGSNDFEGLIMDKVRVLGVQNEPSSITPGTPSYVYNPDTKVLAIKNLNLSMNEEFTVSWT